MKHSRSIQLGPRARRVIRLAARFVNPLVLLIAGRRWMPIVGILHHRGRRTGRNYSSPLGMRPSAGGFVIPVTFSEHAAWYQNVRAAREAVVTYAGRDQVVTRPEVIDYAAAAASFPRYERAQFRLLGIRQFLQLSSVQKPAEEDPMSVEMTKPRNSSIALIVIAVAQLMVVLDVAIVNVALPSIQHALKFNAADLEWVVNAYAIAFGELGRRRCSRPAVGRSDHHLFLLALDPVRQRARGRRAGLRGSSRAEPKPWPTRPSRPAGGRGRIGRRRAARLRSLPRRGARLE